MWKQDGYSSRWDTLGPASHPNAVRRVSTISTAKAKSNGLFKKDSGTSTGIQSKCPAAHLRFTSEEAMKQARSSAPQKATSIWSYVESPPHPDVAFETRSGMAVLVGNLCTGPHSSKLCMEGATTTTTTPGRWVENLDGSHSTSYTFPGDPSALHLPRCLLAEITNRCPNPSPKVPRH